MNIHYIRTGDYFIPDLTLSEENHPIGKWGRMHREYLREYSQSAITACFCPVSCGHTSLT